MLNLSYQAKEDILEQLDRFEDNGEDQQEYQDKTESEHDAMEAYFDPSSRDIDFTNA